jgi:hypothetical protein
LVFCYLFQREQIRVCDLAFLPLLLASSSFMKEKKAFLPAALFWCRIGLRILAGTWQQWCPYRCSTVCKREARKSRMETAGCIGLSSGGKVGIYSLLFYRIIGANWGFEGVLEGNNSLFLNV